VKVVRSFRCHPTEEARMTSCRTSPVITLSDEPHYSAREAAALLGRSFSWLDQRLRRGEFVLPDRGTLLPLRTPGGYRRFTLMMLKDIATSSYWHGWFSLDKTKSVYREILIAAHRHTAGGEVLGPSSPTRAGSRT
jgi:hypothetical protein